MGRRLGEPTIVHHRGRGRRRMGLFDKLRLAGMLLIIAAIVGYTIWLFAFAEAAPVVHMVWLPLVVR